MEGADGNTRRAGRGRCSQTERGVRADTASTWETKAEMSIDVPKRMMVALPRYRRHGAVWSTGRHPCIKTACGACTSSKRLRKGGRDRATTDEEDGRVVGRIPAAQARMQDGRGVEPNRVQRARGSSQRLANEGTDGPTRDKESEGIIGIIPAAQGHEEHG